MSDHGSGSDANKVTLNSLLRKRADVVFDIERAELEVERLRTELVYLDAVIRMFKPDIAEGEMPVRQRRTRAASLYFGKGEVTKRIYAAMRASADGTIACADVAAEAMRDKGFDPAKDNETRKDILRSFATQLNSLGLRGKVQRIGAGRAARWRLLIAD